MSSSSSISITSTIQSQPQQTQLGVEYWRELVSLLQIQAKEKEADLTINSGKPNKNGSSVPAASSSSSELTSAKRLFGPWRLSNKNKKQVSPFYRINLSQYQQNSSHKQTSSNPLHSHQISSHPTQIVQIANGDDISKLLPPSHAHLLSTGISTPALQQQPIQQNYPLKRTFVKDIGTYSNYNNNSSNIYLFNRIKEYIQDCTQKRFRHIFNYRRSHNNHTLLANRVAPSNSGYSGVSLPASPIRLSISVPGENVYHTQELSRLKQYIELSGKILYTLFMENSEPEVAYYMLNGCINPSICAKIIKSWIDENLFDQFNWCRLIEISMEHKEYCILERLSVVCFLAIIKHYQDTHLDIDIDLSKIISETNCNRVYNQYPHENPKTSDCKCSYLIQFQECKPHDSDLMSVDIESLLQNYTYSSSLFYSVNNTDSMSDITEHNQLNTNTLFCIMQNFLEHQYTNVVQIVSNIQFIGNGGSKLPPAFDISKHIFTTKNGKDYYMIDCLPHGFKILTQRMVTDEMMKSAFLKSISIQPSHQPIQQQGPVINQNIVSPLPTSMANTTNSKNSTTKKRKLASANNSSQTKKNQPSTVISTPPQHSLAPTLTLPTTPPFSNECYLPSFILDDKMGESSTPSSSMLPPYIIPHDTDQSPSDFLKSSSANINNMDDCLLGDMDLGSQIKILMDEVANADSDGNETLTNLAENTTTTTTKLTDSYGRRFAILPSQAAAYLNQVHEVRRLGTQNDVEIKDHNQPSYYFNSMELSDDNREFLNNEKDNGDVEHAMVHQEPTPSGVGNPNSTRARRSNNKRVINVLPDLSEIVFAKPDAPIPVKIDRKLQDGDRREGSVIIKASGRKIKEKQGFYCNYCNTTYITSHRHGICDICKHTCGSKKKDRAVASKSEEAYQVNNITTPGFVKFLAYILGLPVDSDDVKCALDYIIFNGKIKNPKMDVCFGCKFGKQYCNQCIVEGKVNRNYIFIGLTRAKNTGEKHIRMAFVCSTKCMQMIRADGRNTQKSRNNSRVTSKSNTNASNTPSIYASRSLPMTPIGGDIDTSTTTSYLSNTQSYASLPKDAMVDNDEDVSSLIQKLQTIANSEADEIEAGTRGNRHSRRSSRSSSTMTSGTSTPRRGSASGNNRTAAQRYSYRQGNNPDAPIKTRDALYIDNCTDDSDIPDVIVLHNMRNLAYIEEMESLGISTITEPSVTHQEDTVGLVNALVPPPYLPQYNEQTESHEQRTNDDNDDGNRHNHNTTVEYLQQFMDFGEE